jgi:small conductance mechanosensitive channel
MQHGYVYQLLRQVGLSDFAASTGEWLLVRPLKIALIVGLAMVASRLASSATKRFVLTVHRRSPLTSSTGRSEQRAATVADVIASAERVVIWSIAMFTILDQVGVNLAPLLAGAGIAGIAIGFGAQTLVKDTISGLFVLLEDQYGVGDLVTLGDTTGTVEDVSLRVTRLRSVDGTVWFIPNGEVRRVGNASMEWSRAIVDVLVPYDEDLAKVEEAIKAAAHELAVDPEWADDLLEEPEVWGVHATTPDGRTVRVVAKTAPRRQAAVARELRGRITERLRRDGIALRPPTLLLSGPDAPPTPPPA